MNLSILLDKKKQYRKKEKAVTHENVNKLLKRRTGVLNGFESNIFSIKKTTYSTGLKILTPKQMFQSLPLALTPLKAEIHLKTY